MTRDIISLINIYVRTVLFNSISKEEGGSESTEDVDPEHLAKRAKRDEETHEELVKKAKQDLEKEKKKTPLDLRPTGILDEDLIFLRQTFPDKVSRGSKFKEILTIYNALISRLVLH